MYRIVKKGLTKSGRLGTLLQDYIAETGSSEPKRIFPRGASHSSCLHRRHLRIFVYTSYERLADFQVQFSHGSSDSANAGCSKHRDCRPARGDRQHISGRRYDAVAAGAAKRGTCSDVIDGAADRSPVLPDAGHTGYADGLWKWSGG